MIQRDGGMNGNDGDAVAHPSEADLQRYVDGEIVPERDRMLVEHVEGCLICADEIDRLRNSAAALALTSVPPPDLFERIRAKRAASIVLTTTGDDSWDPLADDSSTGGHPALEELQRIADGETELEADQALLRHVSDCAQCAREIDRTRVITARLALASQAPPDLWERIKFRRSQGDRVILPLAETRDSRATIAAKPSVTSGPMQSRFRFVRFANASRGMAVAAAAVIVLAIGIRLRARQPQSIAVNTSVAASDSSRTSGHDQPGSRKATQSESDIDVAMAGWRSLSAGEQESRWKNIQQSVRDSARVSSFVSFVALRGDTLLVPLTPSAFDNDTLTTSAQADIRRFGRLSLAHAEFRIEVIGVRSTIGDEIERVRLRTRMLSVARAITSVDSSRHANISTATMNRAIRSKGDSLGVALAVLRPSTLPDGRH